MKERETMGDVNGAVAQRVADGFAGEKVVEPFGEALGVFTSGPYKGKRVKFSVGYTPVTTKAVLESGVELSKAFYLAIDVTHGEFEMREVSVMAEDDVRSALREGRLVERRGLYPSLIKSGKIEYIVHEAHRGKLERAEFKSSEISLGYEDGIGRLCLVNFEPIRLVQDVVVVMDAHQPLGRALQVRVSFYPTAI